MKKHFIKIAGIINLITALIHAIAGQLDLVNPLVNSHLTDQMKGEWIGAWHIVTILLFLTAYVLLKAGFRNTVPQESGLLKSIGILYILSGLPFIIVSFWFSILAPQWILLMPIGILTLLGLKEDIQ